MVIELIELILFAAILGFGIFASHTDLRSRVIPNPLTWLLLILGVVGQLVFCLMGKTTGAHFLFVFFGGFLVGYLLYVLGFWAPGDAKLFWAMLVALPPTIVGEAWTIEAPLRLIWSEVFFSLKAPLWSFLMNAVVSNFIILGSIAISRGKFQSELGKLRNFKVAPMVHLRFLLDILGLCGLVIGGGSIIGQEFTFVHASIASIVGKVVTEKVLSKDELLVLAIPGFLLGTYLSVVQGTIIYFLTLSFATWAIVTIYRIIQASALGIFVQKLAINALQPGMIPLSMESQYVSAGKPLMDEDIARLNDLRKRGELEWLEVETPLPFAPALTIGLGMTVLFQGSIIEPVAFVLSILAS